MRLNATQVRRAIENGGGVWNLHTIQRKINRSWATVAHWKDQPTFPKAVAFTGQGPLYLGEEVIDWFEATGRFDCAERMAAAVQEAKLELRTLSAREGAHKRNDDAREAQGHQEVSP